MKRIIFHIDVNSAYLSWESVRRVQAGQEDLRLVPAAIGGDREKRTGIILAKSIPAKKMGVKTGEPIGMALQKCPELILAKPDFRLYEENSRAFMEICRTYAPVLEKFSIDECFLDMSGTGFLYPDPVKLAHQIKDEIRDRLGFTVNVGVGSNKLLAKMASDFEKPDKVHTLFSEEIETKLWPLPVDDLFTVGRATAERLKSATIKTIGDLANTDQRQIQYLVGQKLGLTIHRFANGIDDSPVLDHPEDAKGYSNSITLEKDVRTMEEGKRILSSLADSVASRMRADRARGDCISVTIRGKDFKDHSHQCKLLQHTDITSEIYGAAQRLLTELWDQRTPLRLLGLSVTGITREEFVQLSLIPDARKDKERKIDQAMDSIRNKYGRATIKRGASLMTKQEVGKKHKAQMELDQKGSTKNENH